MNSSQISQLLDRMRGGDSSASDELMPLIYDELRRMAAVKMNSEKAGHTLSPTALVHEVWLKLVVSPNYPAWNNREGFFAAAGEAMRRILIDAARKRLAAKRGGDLLRVERICDAAADDDSYRLIEILDVNEAMERLRIVDQLSATVVNMHYFSGFTLDETAELLNISRATIYRKWSFARAFLKANFEEKKAIS